MIYLTIAIISLVLIATLKHLFKGSKKHEQLFLEQNFVIKRNDEIEFPKIKIHSNKLEILKYNPSRTNFDFDKALLQSFSRVFLGENDQYIFAEYEKTTFFNYLFRGFNKFKLVLYNTQIKRTDYFKDRPIHREYSIFLGKDIKNKNVEISIKNRQGISITGEMGLGKTALANLILFSLDKNIENEYIFTKTKADFFNSNKTNFIYKDDEDSILNTLRDLKERAIKIQKDLESENYQNIYQKNGKINVLLFDEAHSFLKMESGLAKERKEVRNEIINLVSWFLYQARSVGFIVILITPSAEKENLDLNLRDVSVFISTKISSETVSKNIFNSSIATIIPPKQGLFVLKNGNDTTVFQSAFIDIKKLNERLKWNSSESL